VDVALSSWFVILLAVLAANLPFFNERLFALLELSYFGQPPVKPFWVRLVELVILYFAVGAAAYLLEARIGSVFPQKWEFYAVTGCLFIVLAFPGFVLRYLRKRHD
jgi:hypothetical protein